jgi:ribonuclease-3
LALTHRSAAHELGPKGRRRVLPDNERLEFLGDAVLSLVVSERLFHALPEAPEGGLTRARASLVQEAALAEAARSLGLGAALRLGKGEDRTGGRGKSSLLADCLEALFGAVYLDGGLEAARGCILGLLSGALAVAVTEEVRDARTILQELLQETRGITPTYTILGASGPDHARTYTVALWAGDELRAEGEGASKKAAAQAAARKALDALQATPVPGPEAEGLKEP